jgi:hypothetical protein
LVSTKYLKQRRRALGVTFRLDGVEEHSRLTVEFFIGRVLHVALEDWPARE